MTPGPPGSPRSWSEAQGEVTALKVANLVDARAANGNKGALIAQGKAVKNVAANMGEKVLSATQAVLFGKSSTPKLPGNAPGVLKDMVSGAVRGTMSQHAGAGKVTFHEALLPAEEKAKAAEAAKAKSDPAQAE